MTLSNTMRNSSSRATKNIENGARPRMEMHQQQDSLGTASQCSVKRQDCSMKRCCASDCCPLWPQSCRTWKNIFGCGLKACAWSPAAALRPLNTLRLGHRSLRSPTNSHRRCVTRFASLHFRYPIRAVSLGLTAVAWHAGAGYQSLHRRWSLPSAH